MILRLAPEQMEAHQRRVAGARVVRKPGADDPVKPKPIKSTELAKLAADVAAHTGLQAIAEFRFHPERKWRFDWALIDQRLAVEMDGGIWTGGRHTRGAGYIADMEKLNEAILLGWRVIRCTPQQVADGTALRYVLRALGAE